MSMFTTAPGGDQNAFVLRLKNEKSRLHKDAAYVGALSLALTFTMKYAYTFLVLSLVRFGVFSVEQVTLPGLGLDNTTSMILDIFVRIVMMVVPTVLVSFCYKKRFVPFAPYARVSFGVAFLCIIAAIGLCMGANIANSYFLEIFRELGLYVPKAPETMVETPTSLVLNLLAIAVLPALLEEMVYRGYILRVLRPYGNIFAILVSSALFSLMHGNLRQIPFSFIVGIVLGTLCVITNNIWISIVVHFANNAISVILEYVSFSLPPDHVGVLYLLVIYGLAGIGVFALMLLLGFYWKKLNFAQVKTAMSTSNKMATVFTSPLFVTALFVYATFLLMEI